MTLPQSKGGTLLKEILGCLHFLPAVFCGTGGLNPEEAISTRHVLPLMFFSLGCHGEGQKGHIESTSRAAAQLWSSGGLEESLGVSA